MRLEHVGIAVRDAASTVKILERLFGVAPYRSEIVESEAVRTFFFDADGTKVELLEATGPESPIARHIERRGEGLHHLAFEVADLDAAFQEMADRGFRPLNESPKRGADGKRIFFLHPRDTGGVLVELCQSAPLPMEPEYASAGRARVAFYEHGHVDAPPLVLLHSALGSAETELRDLAARLEPHFRTIAIDFAGHGRSEDLATSELTPDTFADDVIAVLDHLGIERASIFGYSLGGSTALHLALRHPLRVSAVVAHSANVQWGAEEAKVMIDLIDPEAIAVGNHGRAAQLARTHGEARWKPLARLMTHFIRDLPAHRLLNEDLASIEQPVLISRGDRDRYFSLEKAIHLCHTLPNAQLAVHPGLDHSLDSVDGAHLAGMLRRFLS
jgi:methylmalonyl-CoA epimerase